VEGEHARSQIRSLVLVFNRPGDHDLPRSESGIAKRNPRRRGNQPSGLFFEFPGGRVLVGLPPLDFPFDQRPCPKVLAGEVGPTRMGDQHFEPTLESVREKTRGSHRSRHYAGPVITLATNQGVDPVLLDFDPEMQLGHNETLGGGVKRVATEQFRLAAAGFFDGEEVFADAIHEMRKSMKRVRALLRLVRGELGERIYHYENRYLADTARLMAAPRAATAMVLTIELIREIYGEFLAEGTFEEMTVRLAARRDTIHLQVMEDPGLTARVVRNLEKAHNRYASWSTDPDAMEVYGMGIRDEFIAIRPGFRATYVRGRREMVKAYSQPTSYNFHQWRKRAKYLRHQMEFLAPIWPEVVVGMAMTLDRLGSLLGEDHDLAELVNLFRERPDLTPNLRERSLLLALVGQRRSELRLAAEILGRRVYAENPGPFTARFGEYWESRQLALNTPFDTLTTY